MPTATLSVRDGLVAPWTEWERRYTTGRRLLEAGTYALTEGAIAAGCRVFAGYPITPATDIAEYMSRRLPQVGGYYMQCEDELAGMHACAGASLDPQFPGRKAEVDPGGAGGSQIHRLRFRSHLTDGGAIGEGAGECPEPQRQPGRRQSFYGFPLHHGVHLTGLYSSFSGTASTDNSSTPRLLI